MILEFLEEAELELFEAAEWYESKEKGLGKRFRDEIERVLDRIVEDPMLWRERSGGYRRVNCPVFPYYLPFFIRGQKIIIAAVAHDHRKPGYWMSRT
ncbi:MAG: type II toxin-antitoxin system RelE/ParE family toxin [Desulfobacter postgatei]|jgi:plasmid stabilization system protein ParE|uniref:type II toxin-antitoxin system RelE/ParE family toxin n=1 Tax=Desulfobacter postgatei TaxID=2293 RepID=UPI000232BB74|nr:type II toxin-antitoxin system RelE/ParE family toxin [Desulfobacter postgatei]MDD4274512.1 type II toxin-antitoxin system RelE/ParE family toxin [Desulfobacter postgatei]